MKLFSRKEKKKKKKTQMFPFSPNLQLLLKPQGKAFLRPTLFLECVAGTNFQISDCLTQKIMGLRNFRNTFLRYVILLCLLNEFVRVTDSSLLVLMVSY